MVRLLYMDPMVVVGRSVMTVTVVVGAPEERSYEAKERSKKAANDKI